MTVNKTIDLIGEDRNGTIIDGGVSGDVVYVTANWVNISSFTIQYSGYIADFLLDSGIYVYSDYNTITGNIISNNNYGIYLDSSSNNIITSNTISNNGFGIVLDFSSNNLIYDNYFNNTNNAYDEGNNFWNISKTPGTNFIGGTFLGGNYWSDFDKANEGAYDNNSDGIADSPYIILGDGNQDMYPLMETWNESEDWNPWDGDSIITLSELQEAVYYWLTATPVNGHIVVFSDLQEMVYQWKNP